MNEEIKKLFSKLGFVEKGDSIHYYVGFYRTQTNASTLHVDLFIDGDGVNVYVVDGIGVEEIYLYNGLLTAINKANKILNKAWLARKAEVK
jgi:hypothetical protein